MIRARNTKDIWCGLVFIAISGLFAWQALDLPVGSAFRMGPGYFPLLLSGLLALLGAVVLLNGLRHDGEMPRDVAWRAVLILTSAVSFFGFGVAPLGFVPALAGSIFVSALASRKFSLLAALSNTAIVTAFCWAVFIKGLGLPLALLGPWLGGY